MIRNAASLVDKPVKNSGLVARVARQLNPKTFCFCQLLLQAVFEDGQSGRV